MPPISRDFKMPMIILMNDHTKSNMTNSSQKPGAILEIGLRVGVIPFNVTSGHVLLTIFVSFHSLRGQKPLQGALSEVFCTKLRLAHNVKLV